MSKETWDTLGHQKEVNYALRANMTKEEFIKEVTTGIAPPPQYFAKNAMMNKTGYDSLDDVMKRGSIALDPDTFEAIANHEGALVVDTRSAAEFSKAHIPNSIFIGVDGSFAPWVGALISDLKQAIVFLAPEGREEEIVTRFSRVGYDNTMGYLEGGIEAWSKAGKETASVESITATEFEKRFKNGGLHVLDVRKPGEFSAEHVDGAVNLPLDYINNNMEKVDKETEYHIHCAGGYRSMIFASILKARGFDKLVDIQGGFKAIQQTAIPVTDYVCPSTLK
jgi:rhodanese-related sulfurtransferase